MGTHLRELSESYPMNTNMTGFRWLSKILPSLWFWTKAALALEGLIKLMLRRSSVRPRLLVSIIYIEIDLALGYEVWRECVY